MSQISSKMLSERRVNRATAAIGIIRHGGCVVWRSLDKARTAKLPRLEMPAAKATVRLRREVVKTLESRKHAIAEAMLGTLRHIDRWANQLSEQAGEIDAFLERELYAFVDYLSGHFRGQLDFGDLYIGEKRKQFYEPTLSPDEAVNRRIGLTQSDRNAILGIVGPELSEAARELLAQELDSLHEVVIARSDNELRVLFVGDCLFLDIVTFLTGPLLADGITVNPYFVTSKGVAAIRQELQPLADESFDLVFFSPYTYQYNDELSLLLDRRHGKKTNVETIAIAQQAAAETEQVLQMLVDTIDTPHLLVHNTAMVMREKSAWKRYLKHFTTRRVRHLSRQIVNGRLRRYVDARKAGLPQLHLVSETKHVDERGESPLAAYLYESELQHPAELGKVLARDYRDYCFVAARLLGRKLLVLDLDNTMWGGVIAEGPIRHDKQRQQIARRLRERGVLLAIASKNDRANVSWQGGVLSDADFVACEISWNPKPTSIRRIADSLNLSPGHLVFVDDRPDERELVKTAHPNVLTLDANAPRTWRLLELWADMLVEDTEFDRTLAYQQRAERSEFLGGIHNGVEPQNGEMYQQLALQVCIREAKRHEAKRIAELLNRTNQFNCTAMRATHRKVQHWMNDRNTAILVADMNDRFGAMGMVSVAIVAHDAEGLSIDGFVLSCRVFGYGVEKSMLNWMKRRLARLGHGSLRGRIVETPQNQPCRSVYADNGFTEPTDGQNGEWRYEGDAVVADEPWLTIVAP